MTVFSHVECAIAVFLICRGRVFYILVNYAHAHVVKAFACEISQVSSKRNLLTYLFALSWSQTSVSARCDHYKSFHDLESGDFIFSL